MRVSTAVSLVLLVQVGCAGGDGSGGGSAGFTATINGKAWAAEPVGVTARGGGGPGGLVITGSQTSGNQVTSLSLNLHALTGPGTYALGVGLDIFGGSASVGESPPGTGASARWETALDGLGGQLVITSLTASRIVATFQFTAVADKNNTAGGTRLVTAGKIDLPITGTVPPVPENFGSKVSAVLAGKPFNAWAASGRLMDFTGAAGVAVDCHSSEGSISLMLAGVTTPASYPVSTTAPVRTIRACGPGSGINRTCWGVNAPGDTGTITITSLTPARVKGTFSGTLVPQPGMMAASAPLVITDGVFDIGIQ